MTKQRADNILFLMFLILAIFGLVMITSIGVPKSIELSAGDILYPNCSDPKVDCYLLFKKHLLHLILGGIALWLASKIPYRFWKKISVVLFGAMILTLVLVLIAGKANNTFARSWFTFFNTSFQPIEFAKFALILYLAHWLERKNTEVETFQYGFLPFCIVMGAMVLPIIAQPDLGGALVVVAISVAMFFAAGARIRHLLMGGLVAVLLSGIIIANVSHVRERFQAFVATDKNCHEDYCWQSEQANIAVGSGGFWGKGLTQGVQKSYWLPQASDDFIFAASAEELGFVRILLLILVYGIIAYRGLKIAANAPNRFSMLTAIGITVWITIQAFINIAVNLALMPVTGITLPLVSYGGSSILSIMIAAGILLQISKHAPDYAPGSVRRGLRRAHYAERGSYSRA